MNILYMLFKYFVYSSMKKQSQREAAQGIHPTTTEKAIHQLFVFAGIAIAIILLMELLPFIVPLLVIAFILYGFYAWSKRSSGVR